MSIDFITLTFIWLLPLTAQNAVTSDQNHVFDNVTTTVITQEFFTHSKPSSSEEITATKTTQQRSQATYSNMILSNTQTTTAPTSSLMPHLKKTSTGSLTEVQSTVIKSTMTVLTSQASNPTKPTSAPLVPSSSTQSREKTLSTQVMRESPSPSTFSPKSTNLINTTNTFTTPKEDKSESMSPATGDDVKQTTDLYKTSTSIHITKKRKRLGLTEQKENSKNGTNHGKIVSGLIGGSLLLMMMGFLVIFIKKLKLQKQQVTTTDWAGPSPFLEDGADNGQVTLRSSNRISLATFLPLRLSKRLSLLPQTDEELKDMTSATTFGDKNHGTTFGQGVDGNAEPESNETTAVVPQMKNTGDALETAELSVLATSLQTNNTPSTNNEISNLYQDLSANQSNLSGDMENTSAQMNNGL